MSRFLRLRTQISAWKVLKPAKHCQILFQKSWDALWSHFMPRFANMWGWVKTYYYQFLMGWTSIYQQFWGSLGARVLTNSHVLQKEINSWLVLNSAEFCSLPHWHKTKLQCIELRRKFLVKLQRLKLRKLSTTEPRYATTPTKELYITI